MTVFHGNLDKAQRAISRAERLLDEVESRTTTSGHELMVAKATAWATLATAYLTMEAVQDAD